MRDVRKKKTLTRRRTSTLLFGRSKTRNTKCSNYNTVLEDWVNNEREINIGFHFDYDCKSSKMNKMIQIKKIPQPHVDHRYKAKKVQ